MARVKARMRGKAWLGWWQRWCRRNAVDDCGEFEYHDLASAFRAGFRAGWRDRAKVKP